MIWQALDIRIWQLSAIVLLISSRIKLCQVGWGQMHIFRFLQKCLIAFKPRLWLGHSRTFTELSKSYSYRALRVIVLFEVEPSAQSEVLNSLDWVFTKAISIFWCIELFFYSDESLGPCHWKTAPQHKAATSTLYFWVMSSAWFPSNMMFGIEVHQTRESRFSQSEGPLGAFLKQIPSVFSCVFTEERIASGHTSIKHRLECCSDVCPSVGFSYLHIWSWSSTKVTIGFLVTTLTKALLHQLLSLASSRNSPGCSKLLPLRVMETACFCETSMQHIFFWTLPQMCGLMQSCLWALQTVLLTPELGLCSDMHFQLLDLLLRHVCLSKSYPFNWICHRITSLEVQ